MAIIINSFSLLGIHAYPIHIEVDTLYGQPSLSIVGLGDQAVKESRERLEAAIINTKYEFPKMKIVINLSPSDLKKRGSHFDLGMIAKRIPTILPSMTEEESLETTKIYSVAGLLKSKGRLITSRPFRAPHHNASMNSLIGGGTYAMPGEISLAHNGILFLDEIAEFNKRTLDALRQPIEDGHVTISRVQYSHSFPAQFMLIAAMNPCPCGYYGEARCQCTDYEIKKYRSRLSGPIMDRIDIQKTFRTLDITDLKTEQPGPSSKQLLQKVEKARRMQKARYAKNSGITCNAHMTPDLIDHYCSLDAESSEILVQAFKKFNYSARTYHKFLKLARTFADLDGKPTINKFHVIKALMCREIDKEQTRLHTV